MHRVRVIHAMTLDSGQLSGEPLALAQCGDVLKGNIKSRETKVKSQFKSQ
jgi:hypothetical protein